MRFWWVLAMVAGCTANDQPVDGRPRDPDRLDGPHGAGSDTGVGPPDAGPASMSVFVKATNADPGDAFGCAVALSADGSTLAIGAYNEASVAVGVDGDQTDNSLPGSGAVYVLQRGAGAWHYLKADVPAQTHFGSSVALSADGTRLVVGAAGAPPFTGAAFVFDVSGPSWRLSQRLPMAVQLGYQVAISADGSTIGVGAYDDPSSGGPQPGGVVRVFQIVMGRWSEMASLVGANTEAGDQFGASLTISSDGRVVAVGAPGEDSIDPAQPGNNGGPDAGAAYVFVENAANNFVQQWYGKVPMPMPGQRFGASIAQSESTLIIGVPGDISPPVPAGSAYAVTGANQMWSIEGRLTPMMPNGMPSFGSAVGSARSGGLLAVGAPLDGGATGSVYVFGPVGPQLGVFHPPSLDPGDLFGGALALATDGSTLAVGAVGDDSSRRGLGGSSDDNLAPNSGAVYVFAPVAP